MLDSIMCRQEHFRSDWYRKWESEMFLGVPHGCRYHRKNWEFCAIAQALNERDMLRPGRKAIGFAVGREPLASLFASRGVQVEATDLGADSADAEAWQNTDQHTDSRDHLLRPQIIHKADFEERVTFYPADMRDLSNIETGEYDFVWSSCAFEHLGSLQLGLKFVREAMELLKPGGVAVHTTEINVSSNDRTQEDGIAVIYRRRDFENLDLELRRDGMCLERLDMYAGSEIHDRQYDYAPYNSNGREHVKLQLGEFISTSQLVIAYR